MNIKIILPDNSVKTFSHEPTILEVAQSIGSRLAQDALGGMVNGEKEVLDLRTPLKDGSVLKIITAKDPEGLEVLRHSAAHVLAQAVQELWPEIKVTIGPVIDDGFYYDFDSPRAFSPEDLVTIENQMRKVISRNEPVLKEVWASKDAIQTFTKMGENFKVEIITDLKEEYVSVYKQGSWVDLCRGPHVQRLGQIKAVKVLSLAGSYWRGEEKNKQLQRIYATAFADQKQLDEYLHNLEEAKKRDHRKLGKELGLFYFHSFAPGSPFFTPKGTTIYNALISFIREKYLQYGYEEVITPQVFDLDLFHQSGHYKNYRENMYFTRVDERDFSMKPMNCPSHCLLYGSELRSYRDLPWRVADFGRLHRYERSGVMHGLNRVRTFCQDDAHIFCRVDQIQTEISSFMTMLNDIYRTLGLENYKVYLSTRPELRMGDDKVWDQAELALENALNSLNLPFTVNKGDGAFYGPKLDIMFVDALKRPWQLGTLQLDFNLPEAFSLKFIGSDNKDHKPVMIHRAILGSLERFIGVYLEHTSGHFPLWLAPQQVRIVTVNQEQNDYGAELEKQLFEHGIRVALDGRNEKLGFKIREAQLQKVPCMIVLGESEKTSGKISLRLNQGVNKSNLDFKVFLIQLKKAIVDRTQKFIWNDNDECESVGIDL